MTPHLARSGGPGACDSSGSLRPHLHLTLRTRPSAGRPPARRPCTRGQGRAPRPRVGEGLRGTRKAPARAEREAEPRPSTPLAPAVGFAGPAAAPLLLQWQRRGASRNRSSEEPVLEAELRINARMPVEALSSKVSKGFYKILTTKVKVKVKNVPFKMITLPCC
ncbi:hypothetical protein AB1E18_018322 [Capra hircus]